jgi:hypothetical protein
MADDTWTIAEDFAHWHCQGDIARGLREIDEMLGDAEHWLEKLLRRSRWVWLTAGGSFTASASALLASVAGHYHPAWASPVVLGVSVFVFGLAFSFTSILQKFRIEWANRFPFSSEQVSPLIGYLRRCVEDKRPIFAVDGEEIESAFLLNPWAIFLLSKRAVIRGVPADATQGPLYRRYALGACVRKPAGLPTTILPPEATTLNILFDQRTQILDQSATHIFVCRDAETKTDLSKEPTRAGAKEDHWMFSVEDLEFPSLSKRVAHHWTGGTARQQVQTMLDIGFVEFKRNPTLAVTAVRRVVVAALEKRNLPIGLETHKQDATEWIDRMLARDTKHSYKWVKRAMTDPNFRSKEEIIHQPELDLSEE